MTSDISTSITLHFLLSPPEDSLLYIGEYDPFWVAISVLLSIIASYAALNATSRIEHLSDKTSKMIWLLIGSFTLGIGIWAMHFIGMMALQLPCGISYDPSTTLLSMVPGILAASVAIGVVGNQSAKHLSPLWGSILLGAGIGTMHYTGMAAMQLDGVVRYNPTLFALSILVAVMLSYLALRVKTDFDCLGKRCDVKGAIILGFAVSGMHYTAMSAAYFVRGDVSLLPSSFLTSTYLAVAIAIATVILAIAALALATISRNREITDQLRENDGNFNSLIEAIPDAIFLKDGEGRWQVTNEAAKKLFQLHSIPWMGKSEMEIAELHPEFRDAHEACFHDDERTWKAGELTIFAELIPDEMGKLRNYEVRKVPVFNEQGERHVLVIIGRDITEQKRAEKRLLLSSNVFTHASEGILICDIDGTILDVNKAFTKITGYSREEAIGENPRILNSGRQDKEFYTTMWRNLVEEGFHFGEIWNKRKNGEVYAEMLTISAVRDAEGRAIYYVSMFSDISNSKMSDIKIHHLAFYDTLTGLPNRRLLIDRLQTALAVSSHSNRYGAVLSIDIDNFKIFNDLLGFEIGDQLLVEVANRIQKYIREVDTVARLGGDDFIVLLEDIDIDDEQAKKKVARIAENIRTSFTLPFQLNGNEFICSISIGVSTFVGNKSTPEDLLKQIDMSKYRAKEDGRNTIQFFDPSMQLEAEFRASLEADLRRAVAEKQLQLHYQLQVDNDLRAIGAEALVRWNHPTRGMVSPAQFIPLAEESSLILGIGQWVMETACKQLAAWSNAEQTKHFTLAVNVSAKQLKQSDFVETVANLLIAHRVDASKLKIELTEGVVLNDVADIVSKMLALKFLGIKLSMDDFGTGYSSLSYLKQLPLDQLKIDQSFVRDMTTNPTDAVMVQTIIDMAKNFSLNVIAEGVETEAQLSQLKQLGCMAYQGYLFSKPVSIEHFHGLLSESSNMATCNKSLADQ